MPASLLGRRKHASSESTAVPPSISHPTPPTTTSSAPPSSFPGGASRPGLFATFRRRLSLTSSGSVSRAKNITASSTTSIPRRTLSMSSTELVLSPPSRTVSPAAHNVPSVAIGDDRGDAKEQQIDNAVHSGTPRLTYQSPNDKNPFRNPSPNPNLLNPLPPTNPSTNPFLSVRPSSVASADSGYHSRQASASPSGTSAVASKTAATTTTTSPLSSAPTEMANGASPLSSSPPRAQPSPAGVNGHPARAATLPSSPPLIDLFTPPPPAGAAGSSSAQLRPKISTATMSRHTLQRTRTTDMLLSPTLTLARPSSVVLPPLPDITLHLPPPRSSERNTMRRMQRTMPELHSVAPPSSSSTSGAAAPVDEDDDDDIDLDMDDDDDDDEEEDGGADMDSGSSDEGTVSGVPATSSTMSNTTTPGGAAANLLSRFGRGLATVAAAGKSTAKSGANASVSSPAPPPLTPGSLAALQWAATSSSSPSTSSSAGASTGQQTPRAVGSAGAMPGGWSWDGVQPSSSQQGGVDYFSVPLPTSRDQQQGPSSITSTDGASTPRAEDYVPTESKEAIPPQPSGSAISKPQPQRRLSYAKIRDASSHQREGTATDEVTNNDGGDNNDSGSVAGTIKSRGSTIRPRMYHQASKSMIDLSSSSSSRAGTTSNVAASPSTSSSSSSRVPPSISAIFSPGEDNDEPQEDEDEGEEEESLEGGGRHQRTSSRASATILVRTPPALGGTLVPVTTAALPADLPSPSLRRTSMAARNGSGGSKNGSRRSSKAMGAVATDEFQGAETKPATVPESESKNEEATIGAGTGTIRRRQSLPDMSTIRRPRAGSMSPPYSPTSPDAAGSPSTRSITADIPPPSYRALFSARPRDDEGRERLPPYSCSVHIEGVLTRKMEFSRPGVQAKDRAWKKFYFVLNGTGLRVYKLDPRRFPVKGVENGATLGAPHGTPWAAVPAASSAFSTTAIGAANAARGILPRSSKSPSTFSSSSSTGGGSSSSSSSSPSASSASLSTSALACSTSGQKGKGVPIPKASPWIIRPADAARIESEADVDLSAPHVHYPLEAMSERTRRATIATAEREMAVHARNRQLVLH
ncbi:hypothetical protein DL93DRAFT_1550479 [Clavulina sp. PMI_390]|nr:hypothetical protein DL93DRAFT_1550479 [Clavulina sp. PMI_390]